MSEPPQSVEAPALRRFLMADPDDWPRLSPGGGTEAVGADTLQRIVRATLTRVGELGALRIEGSRCAPP
ncbi:hypothetical protein AB0I51_16770 [Streptomyces sp. NPDC050549]|uniref:hypothetical protein n=1 Tax=Streptomyces sp. NPDC050549 TaxID=3155406 RepID=UPI00341A784D